MNKKELIKSLNKALADEWLSYYRYWIGAKVIEEDKDSIAAELGEMATAELKHAGILADQIVGTGETPILKPSDWQKMANWAYEIPKDFSPKSILFQNIKSKQCAVEVYKKLVNCTKHKDASLSGVLLNILEEEIEQKDDLINMMEHLEGKSSE